MNIPQWDSPYANGVHQATPWISHPDNIKSFFQTGYSQSHNISVVTKGERATTRASLGFRDQKGTLPNTDQNRISAQMNTNVNVNKYISFDLSMNFTRTKSDNLPQGSYNAANPLQSILQWFGRQVNMESLKICTTRGTILIPESLTAGVRIITRTRTIPCTITRTVLNATVSSARLLCGSNQPAGCSLKAGWVMIITTPIPSRWSFSIRITPRGLLVL